MFPIEFDRQYLIGRLLRKTAEAIGLSFNTVAAAVKKLTDMKILTQTNAVSRNRTFAYTEYLDLLRDGT